MASTPSLSPSLTMLLSLSSRHFRRPSPLRRQIGGLVRCPGEERVVITRDFGDLCWFSRRSSGSCIIRRPCPRFSPSLSGRGGDSRTIFWPSDLWMSAAQS
ncbi:PREDICTED: uncharacterized protein LOC109162037 [Ipomoea nil]|uniref:uncharacterized protein LOC109162037 n=1 Tax=Ipomoea nil TaxID=35883 RepID=UPI000901600D|nr:PREDICTED: uncharacterized protein LOC109162037 [Ipomoea nil]